MITILAVIICIVAAYIIYCSGTGAIGMSELLQNDIHTCPKDYLPVQSMGRRIVMINNICQMLSAGVMLIFGLSFVGRAGQTYFLTSSMGLAGAALLLCLASLGAMLAVSAYDFRQIRDGIMAQWKKEKRISERHDDEVRLYRILGEVTSIPRDNARIGVYIGCLYILSILPN